MEATSDFTQEDKLDDPRRGDAMRPEGEAATAETTAAVFGALRWLSKKRGCL